MFCTENEQVLLLAVPRSVQIAASFEVAECSSVCCLVLFHEERTRENVQAAGGAFVLLFKTASRTMNAPEHRRGTRNGETQPKTANGEQKMNYEMKRVKTLVSICKNAQRR